MSKIMGYRTSIEWSDELLKEKDMFRHFIHQHTGYKMVSEGGEYVGITAERWKFFQAGMKYAKEWTEFPSRQDSVTKEALLKLLYFTSSSEFADAELNTDEIEALSMLREHLKELL